MIFHFQMQAMYSNYYGDYSKSLEHFIECGNWQKAHTTFMTYVAHSLFLSGRSILLFTSVLKEIVA